MSAELEKLVETSLRELHGITSRARTEDVAAQVARLNALVRDTGRARLRFTDQPADFPATLLRNADV